MVTKVVIVVVLAALWSPSQADLSTAPITTDWIPKVSRKMTTFAESQTGALQLVKEYDDNLSFTQVQIDGEAQLHLMTQAAGDRLKMCRDILHRNKAEIEASHAQGPTGGAPTSDCCDNIGQLEYDPRFLQQIVNDSCGTLAAVTGAPNTVRPAVYDTMKSNIHEMSGATWQYYGAKQGEYHQFPKNDRSCEGNAHIFRDWYVSAASPKKKNVVIVIDVSYSMSYENRINLAKQAALTVLDTLTARDWVGVVSFSDNAETPEGCLGDSLGEANPSNIAIMRDFINNLRHIQYTHYSKGFKKAFDIFSEAKRKQPGQFYDCHNIIIFLTDGEPTDPQDVLDQITEGQNRMGRSVHIFTYGLGDALGTALSGWCHDPNDTCSSSRSSKGFSLSDLLAQLQSSIINSNNADHHTVGIPALDFLATIADQNNMQISNAVSWTNENCRHSTHGLCSDPNRDPQGVGPPGRTDSVGDGEGERLMTMMGSYYDFFQSEPEPTFSIPTKDSHLGLTITAAIRTVDTTNKFFGVTAVDISMDIVFNEIFNFNLGSYSHAFLVDREDGRVLLHRDLPKPMEWPSDPTFLNLDAMKGALSDDEVTKILNGESGNCYYDNVKVPVTRGNAQFDGVITVERKATFYYEPIPDTKYSVVLCLFDEDSTVTVPSSVDPENGADSLFHRLDLLNTTTGVCRLYDNYATLDGSTVMFPPGAYSDPIGYLGSLETSDDVANIEQFLNDATGSVSNPGLVDGVRTDVVLTTAIEQYWRENDAESVWRYVGTRNGMFRIFPGITVDRRYDPTQQTWYMRALSRPQDYTFSRPVPSPFGGGNMVTISRVIAHTSNQEILGVIAADITERQYYSLLYSEVPECLSSAEFECFLLDDSGYFMELPTAQNVEHDHLTNRFPWLAKELVASGEFLMSGWCNSYVTHNSQLYYDTSGFTGLDVTSGPPCTQFSMYPVNNTNTFLLVLHNRQTNNCDDSQRQDCSCDEVCQTCDTNAQSTCQCPCSCAWDYESCTNGILGVLTDVPCPPPRGVQSTPGMGQTDGQPPYQPDSSVQDCEEMCSAQSGSITCEALPHCVWCQELDFPVCNETCFQTTPEPTTTLQTTTDATTTIATTVEPTTDATTTIQTTLQPTTDATTMAETTLKPTTDGATTENPETTEESTTIIGVTTPNIPMPATTPVSVLDCGTKPAGMYPDPHDCTKFYQCTGDPNNPLPVHKDCAPGTLFDWNLYVCTLTSHCTASAAASTILPTTTAAPTTLPPTTAAPTTLPPTTAAPTTLPPTTAAPRTLPPTTAAPPTLPPTTAAPTTLPPTTAAPTTLPPTTAAPTTLPTATTALATHSTVSHSPTHSPTSHRPASTVAVPAAHTGQATTDSVSVPSTADLQNTVVPSGNIPTAAEPTIDIPSTVSHLTGMMSTTDFQTAGVPGTGDSISVPLITNTPAVMVPTTDFQTAGSPGAGQTTYVSPIANQPTPWEPTTGHETGTGSQANLPTGMTSPTDIPTTGPAVTSLSTSLSPVPSIQTATVTAPTTAPGIAVTPGTGHSTSGSLPANYPSTTVPTTHFHSNTAPQITGPETDPPTNIASTTDIGTAAATTVDLPTTWVSKTVLSTPSPAGTSGSAIQVTHDVTTVEDTTDPVSTTDQSGTAEVTNAVEESTLKPLYSGSSLICPNMPAGLSPSDYTDVKFLLDFAPYVNFTEIMSKSLDQRQHLEYVTQSMVYERLTAEVAATVANIWPKEFGISFTVHKAFHRNDINMTAMAEEFHANWANGSVGLDIFGLGVKMKPPGLSYERGFWSVCEEDCSKLDSQACYQHTSCQWCVFEGAPHCGADCLLQEPEYEMSVFCPCLLEHKVLEQQLQDSFRDQVQQLLRGRFGGWDSTKPMYSINTTGSTITFSLKSSLQQRITPEVIDFLRNDSNWNGVTINDGFNQYQIMEPTGYTDVDVIVEFNDVDFTNLVGQFSISVDGLRFALNTTLTSIGVSPDCVASTRILRRGKNVLEFSMSRALNSTVNLTAEVNKLVEANRNGEFTLNLRPGWPVSKSVSKTETFDSICPSVDLWTDSSAMDTVYPPGMCPCPTEGSISLVYEDQAANTGLSTPDKLGLAVSLPIAVAALSALGVLLMFYFKKKGSNRPPTAFRRTAVSPAVQSFETNIYSASIDDHLSHQFGKKGSQLNRFRDPDAVYGRLSYSPPPSTASSTLTSEMSLPGSPDDFY